ncbi:MAG: flavodoxin [Parabacteroides sp.]|jgi:flavodoxin
MRRRNFLLTVAAMTAAGPALIDASIQPPAKGKCLIAYFSRKGMNYVSGKIIDLKVGNTEVIAKKIQAHTSGDLFKIETVKTYPSGYDECTKIAQKELNEKARPKLTGTINNIKDYDVIYLGYPIWWGTMPMAVYTFLASYDFTGKTIIPFCTHEGSDLGSSVQDIKKVCPKARVLQGLAIKGSNVNDPESDKTVAAWIKKSK